MSAPAAISPRQQLYTVLAPSVLAITHSWYRLGWPRTY
jgi:hypothetical protein